MFQIHENILQPQAIKNSFRNLTFQKQIITYYRFIMIRKILCEIDYMIIML